MDSVQKSGLKFFVAIFALVFHLAVAADHDVGGSAGWMVPTSNSALYTSWASNQTFNVGDRLVFKYITGTHTVDQVTKTNYDSCTSTSPLATYTNGPTTVTLNRTGTLYFICGIPGHCSGGQKVAVTVASSASTPTVAPASPPTAGGPSPTPTATPSSPSGVPTPTNGGSPPGAPASGPAASTTNGGSPPGTAPASGPAASTTNGGSPPGATPAGGPAASSPNGAVSYASTSACGILVITLSSVVGLFL
eukprot:Gb_00868 [translate_table: standard]